MIHRDQLLRDEVRSIQESHLGGFSARVKPTVGLTPSMEVIWFRYYPLPDHYRPDHLHMAMVVDKFPVEPPKGIYLLHGDAHDGLIRTLQKRFNVFHDRVFHGAPTVAGYEWICIGYLDGWRYNIRAPHRGDNISKMLAAFWRGLEETT